MYWLICLACVFIPFMKKKVHWNIIIKFLQRLKITFQILHFININSTSESRLLEWECNNIICLHSDVVSSHSVQWGKWAEKRHNNLEATCAHSYHHIYFSYINLPNNKNSELSEMPPPLSLLLIITIRWFLHSSGRHSIKENFVKSGPYLLEHYPSGIETCIKHLYSYFTKLMLTEHTVSSSFKYIHTELYTGIFLLLYCDYVFILHTRVIVTEVAECQCFLPN